MEKQVKFIWEFRGEDAEGTAKHHCIHLDEYAQNNALKNTSTDFLKEGDTFYIAHIIVNESNAEQVHADLKPLRGNYLKDG